MQVEKRINNNVVLAREGQQQLVLFGNGLGFQAYPGEPVDQSKIEKKFYPAGDITYTQMAALVTGAGKGELKSTYKIVDAAKEQFPDMNDIVYFTLLDHLLFCLKRMKQDMPIVNPLEWEVKRFYPDEYKLGRRFLEIIEEVMAIKLPETEAAFFALHFVNAQLERATGNEVFELTEMTNMIIKIVQYHFQCEFDEDSLFYNRFITHVRYYLMRQMRNEKAPISDSFLIEAVRKARPDEYECVCKIARYLYEKRGWVSSEAEKMYLILHITNLVRKNTV